MATLPLMISSPLTLKIGSLSPVKELSSKLPSPETITPSIATFSPALTSMISPGFTSSTGTISFVPLSMTVTSVGRALDRESIVSAALFLLKTSRYLPAKTKVMIIVTESK